jgi:hypothetical protein
LAAGVAVAAVACLLAACGVASAAVPLPDDRAWEMVSPLDKNGGDILGEGQAGGGGVEQAAADGEALAYVAFVSFADPQGASIGSQYLATRHGTEGWATHNITLPAISGTTGLAGVGTPFKAFSSYLTTGLVQNGTPTASEAPIENPPRVQGAPAGYQNFYLRSSIDGSLRALLTFTPPQPAQGFYMRFEAATPDLAHVVVSSAATLTPGAVSLGSKPNLYEWAGGEWQAVNVQPEVSDGRTTPESILGSGYGESHVVSDDGSRVFWSNGLVEAPALFVRQDGVRTVQLDAPQGGERLPGEKPETLFQTASSDGSLAFFTSHAPLTSDANTGPPCSGSSCKRAGSDLYEFDVPSGTLRDLTPDHKPGDPNGAEAQGVLGASEDGSYVYFVATAALAGANAEGRSPSSGDNLYLWHEAPGKPPITFVASLSGTDLNDWTSEVLRRTARVTPSGNALAFMSNASLTGYDNRDAVTESPDAEVYLYDTASSHLSCASCNPSGARPLGPSSISAGAPFEHQTALGGAIYQPRALSEDGSRVFFDSGDALAPQDTNGAQDVYEYEGGRVYLISGGTAEEGAEFVDASANGNDVFFRTRQELVRGDTDQLIDLYDARVGGGIAEPPLPPPCQDESCKPSASPQPTFAPRGSAIFKGAGNLAPPAPVSVTKGKTKKSKHKAKRRRAKRSRGARRRG